MSFSITNPRTSPAYSTMDSVPVDGTWSGGNKPNKMWVMHTTGACPSDTKNPYEAGAMEGGVSINTNGTWSATSLTALTAGTHCVTVWSIEPGSLSYSMKRQQFTVESGGMPPPG